jgi:hypothetical protein
LTEPINNWPIILSIGRQQSGQRELPCDVNYAIFNSIFVYKNLNPDFLIEIQRILVNVAKAWATVNLDGAETESGKVLV